MKSSPVILILLLTLHCALFGAGCSAGKHPPAASTYTTLPPDPSRNLDGARELNRQAVDLIAKGDWAQAEQTLKIALDADVTCGPAHNNLGKVYFHEGKLYLAAWEFQYAAKLMPNQPEPRNNLGLVLEQAGKLDDAVKSYDEALVLEPDSAQILGNAARCRVRRGDKDEKTTDLLEKLMMRETRPTWLNWAKEQLAVRGRAIPE